MISPRRTTLIRTPDLAGFRTALLQRLRELSAWSAGDTFVIVPSAAAGEQLRRTVEDDALAGPRAIVLPRVGTRAAWYQAMAARLPSPPRLLSSFEREVVLTAAARAAEARGIEAPFRVRPSLVADMIDLYDHIRCLGRSIADFERNFRDHLAPAVDFDRGAVKLLEQTIFLAAVFGDYEARVGDIVASAEATDGLAGLPRESRTAAGLPRRSRIVAKAGVDEHVLRARLLVEPSERPITDAIVTVGDRQSDPDGLWPADFDLLARVPGLARVDIVATEGALTAGLLGRLHALFPGIDEARVGEPSAGPQLIGPPAGPAHDAPRVFVSRDREEELTSIARRVKAEQRLPGATPLDRIALVVHRPLPYLYLARDVFAGAGIPFETLDTLPLAAEPYAGAVDLVLEWVISDFARASTIALLRSPHFDFGAADFGTAEAVPSEDFGTPKGVPYVRGDDAAPSVRDVSQMEGTPSVSEMEGTPLGVPTLDLDIAAFDVALAEARYLGGLDRLRALVDGWSAMGEPTGRIERRLTRGIPAARVAFTAAQTLAPLAEARPMVAQIDTLLAFLHTFDRPAAVGDPDPSRRQRVRGAVVDALVSLASAYRHHDAEATADVSALSAAVRRWLGARTFAARTGVGGLQIVDVAAARYGTFDDVQLVGVIDGDWPERTKRPVFFPASLMGLLEPESADPDRRERDAVQAARASFIDLLRLPGRESAVGPPPLALDPCELRRGLAVAALRAAKAESRQSRGVVRVSTVLLENDAVVEPSMLLDELPNAGLATADPRLPTADFRLPTPVPHVRIFQHEAMTETPYAFDALPDEVAAWARVRTTPRDGDLSRFRGAVGGWRLPRISVSRLERYLDCPFRFYASEVLALEEEPEDEDTRTPLERGRFLHELFEEFYAEWQRQGHRGITVATVDEARTVFREVCERKLTALSPSEAMLERVRLEGSAVSAGIAHRVFEMEAARPTPIVERLLEYAFDGAFTFRRADGDARAITLRGKADRIDLLADGTLRVIDYKSNKTPDLKQALQLPVYSVCARERLQGHGGRSWTIGEAAYLSFEGERAVVPLRQRDQSLDQMIASAEDRLLATLDAIESGVFPPRPAKKSLCTMCAFSEVCRKEWVEVDDE